MQIAIRTDASGTIGAGHLMRTLALANELSRRGAQCHFLCRECPPTLATRVREYGHLLTIFPSFPADERADAEMTASLTCSDNPDWIIVDHYGLSATWENVIGRWFPRVMAIDDLPGRAHAADLLLDQNLGRTKADYHGRVSGSCSLLTGSRYALLRPEFAAVRERSLKARSGRRPNRVLITMGGSDPLNATCAVLDALSLARLPEDTQLTIVLGTEAAWRSEVETACKCLPWQTSLLQNVSDMAILMQDADIAISAAGSTLWELCCVGVPSIALVVADNQRASASAAAKAGAILVIESARDLPLALSQLLDSIADTERFSRMQEAASSVTDGLGCIRVADALTRVMGDQNTVSLRRMCADDLETVRQWRNHPDIRRWMHTPNEISEEEHAAWFARCRNDASQALLIAEAGDKPLGFVRFSGIGNDVAEWGFYKTPDAPAGSGTRLGQAALAHAFGELAIQRVSATVLSENQRSLQFHRKLGFRPSAASGNDSVKHLMLDRADWISPNHSSHP